MKPGLTRKERAAIASADTIFELPVYDGALKHWRVLNLSTGTIYSSHYETAEGARSEIEEGAVRVRTKTVRGTDIHEAQAALTLWRATK